MNTEFFTADFSLLPPHIITHILIYLKLDDLKSASSVCTSWHYASNVPQITRTLIVRPKEENIAEICKSSRKYGILEIFVLKFNKPDSHYIQLYKQLGPFTEELRIYEYNNELKRQHLLKLLEHTTSLKVLVLNGCSYNTPLPSLFPVNYDFEAKERIITNLSAIKSIVIQFYDSFSFIADIVQCTTNLQKFEISNGHIQANEYSSNLYKEFFKIFDNNNTKDLTHLNLNFSFRDYVDNFITSFVKIKLFNLISLTLGFNWNWKRGLFNESLVRQLISKLKSLVDLTISHLEQYTLLLICQELVSLKRFTFRVPNRDQSICELVNLKKLEKLCCSFPPDYINGLTNQIEIDKFFKCKFENLRIFQFEALVTEYNLLQLCENHPNLIELIIDGLVTRNLEIIFKHLTKLRILVLYFGFSMMSPEELGDSETDDSEYGPMYNPDVEYEYKISRLQDLEEFTVDQLVNGIREDEINQLKKLHSTNIHELFHSQSCRY